MKRGGYWNVTTQRIFRFCSSEKDSDPLTADPLTADPLTVITVFAHYPNVLIIRLIGCLPYRFNKSTVIFTFSFGRYFVLMLLNAMSCCKYVLNDVLVCLLCVTYMLFTIEKQGLKDSHY